MQNTKIQMYKNKYLIRLLYPLQANYYSNQDWLRVY